MTSRAQLTIDLGPSLPFAALAQLVADLATVISFAEKVQDLSNRNEAAWYLLQNGEIAIEESWDLGRQWRYLPLVAALTSDRSFLASGLFERQIQRVLDNRGSTSEVQVEELKYGSPFGINIKFDGNVVPQILRIIRDWKSKRRLDRAKVSEYEDTIRFRHELREIVLRSLTAGETRLGRDQVGELLTSDVLGSMNALTGAAVQVEIEEETNDSDQAPESSS